MFLGKKHKHNFFKPQFLLASFFTSILSVLLFCATTTVFAASAPPYLTLSISTPTVNFHFNQAENAASAFKEDMAVVQYNTDNKTGFTAYVSSIDEDTSLNHVDSSVTQKITSITTPGGAATFGSKNWGYLANQTTASTTSFNPIPKVSQPDQALNISLPEGAKFFLHFGVKTGSDLPAGTYSKKILVTAITNYVPTSATFLTGPVVNGIIRSVNTGHDVEFFKKAAAAPPVGVHTETVSTADSDLPIYLWYDQAQKTIFWWSNADTVYINEDSNYMLANINDNSTLVQLIDMRGINTSRMKNAHHMFWTKEGLTKHIDLSEFDTSNLEDVGYMFSTPYETVSTAQIDPIDFSHFNTSKVKIMTGMFAGSYLPSIDIRNFDTRNVVDMQYTFAGLKNVRHLDLHGFDVSKVNNIGAIFSGNPTLVSLNLANWQLDSIHAMDSLFAGMHALTDLNLTGFTTKNVTDMHHMFTECHALTTLDLSSFDTRNVTDMNNMFRDNFALKNLNLSSFNTSNVTNMKEMFRHDGVIYPLDVSTFDTRRVTNMDGMFYWTLMSPENATLDISNFDTRSLTSALGMFNYTKAKTIYASDQFNVNNVAPHPHEMFITNTNLVGGNGTQYVWPNNSSQYAHIDAPGNPGYFTRKP
ncbi:MAG: BspA family leucine-rich repeat surface protein [Candidatus Nanosynbacter sp.]|nr:BspA family leucine-rich repeat surface protein [Candidatus Nanosynbacter sp.]